MRKCNMRWFSPQRMKKHLAFALAVSLIAMVPVSAFAQVLKISMTKTNVSIENVLRELEKQSDIIQFFHIPTIGSILLAGILALIYLLTNDAIKKITGHNDLLLLSLIPSIYLFLYSMTVDHSLTPIIATFLGLLIMGLFHQITVRPWSFIRKIYSPLPPNNKYRLLILRVHQRSTAVGIRSNGGMGRNGTPFA